MSGQHLEPRAQDTWIHHLAGVPTAKFAFSLVEGTPVTPTISELNICFTYRYEYPLMGNINLTTRPATRNERSSPRDSASSQDSSPRSPRAKTAPPGYKTMPPINRQKKVKSLDAALNTYLQLLQ